MKKVLQKITSLILIFTLLVILLPQMPQNVYAIATPTYEYRFDSGGATLIRYYGSEEIVKIPATYGTVPVTGIGDQAFKEIQSSIVLKEIILPDSITNIGNSAFNYLVCLTKINIGKNVNKIGINPFAYCYKLSEINLDKDNAFYCSINGAIYNKNQTELITYPCALNLETCILPNSLLKIGANSFSANSSITTISIPDSVTEIGSRAFTCCSNLKNLTFGNSLITINEGAFSGCYSLDSVILPDSIELIAENAFIGCTALATLKLGQNLDEIKDKAFYGCKKIKELIIPNQVTSIGVSAFEGTTSLETLTFGNSINILSSRSFFGSGIVSLLIGDSLTEIGSYTFENCTNLESVSIGIGLQNVGYRAFNNTPWLSDYSTDFITINSILIFYKGIETNITIPENITTITYPAFSNNSKIKSVIVGDNVKFIEKMAFSYCSSLESVTIGNNVTEIAESVFDNCGALKTVNLGTGITKIGYRAFCYCGSLLNFNTGDNIIEIGKYAFSGCGSLNNIVFGSGLLKIDNYAFSGCNSLVSITLGNNVTEIGDGLFTECQALTTINIGTALTKIGNGITCDCFNLLEVNISPRNIKFCSIDGILFSKDQTKIILYPAGKSEQTIYIPKYIKSIGSYAFASCKYLENVLISYSVKTIEDYAFYNCSNLKAAVFLGNAPVMGTCVFDLHLSDFAVFYISGKSGFQSIWNDHYCYPFLYSPNDIKAVSASYSSIKLTWTDTGADGYIIYRYNGSSYVPYKDVKTNSFTDTSLTCGTKYIYKIASYIVVENEKIYTEKSNFITAVPIPAMPSSFVATKYSSTSVKLSWAAVSGASGYTIYRYNSTKKTYIAIANVSSLAYVNNGLSKKTTYYYKVAAYRNVNGKKIYGYQTGYKIAKTT